MGLKFTGMAEWQRWQTSQRSAFSWIPRRARATDDEASIELWVRGHEPELLVACDSNFQQDLAALLDPLALLPDVPLTIAKPVNLDLMLPPGDWRRRHYVDLTVRSVVSLGSNLPVGAWAARLASIHNWTQWVVQSGMLHQYSPPPPRNARLLAWSDNDAEYWTTARPDLTAEVVGSQYLATAALHPAPQVGAFDRPFFAGQLHRCELHRRDVVKTVTAFWRDTNAIYRPALQEDDRFARQQHRRWRRMGMTIDQETGWLEMNRPTVSIYDVGVLLAAARGLPAWVHHPEPAEWLLELWERYRLSAWRGTPTPALEQPEYPALAISQLLMN